MDCAFAKDSDTEDCVSREEGARMKCSDEFIKRLLDSLTLCNRLGCLESFGGRRTKGNGVDAAMPESSPAVIFSVIFSFPLAR